MDASSIQALMAAACLDKRRILGCRSSQTRFYSRDILPGSFLRRRSRAVSRLNAAIAAGQDGEGLLWEAMTLFAGYAFRTARGLTFSYKIRGGEMFVDRKDKSITASTVLIAFRKALELGRVVKGPKKLGTFGASYLYPVFIRLGVIQKTR